MMALIRGVRGAAPCPVCLVPQDQQVHLNRIPLHLPRTKEDAHSVVGQAYATRVQQESHLQPQGLRPIEVSLVSVITHLYVTNVDNRMSFGEFPTVILTVLCHGIVFMHTILGSSVTIYLMSSKRL